MNDFTVLIPTSPIPSHPSTTIIEKVIESIRRHLPESEIWLLCDGVRQEVEHRREQYREYLINLAEWSTHQKNIHMWTFGKHRHQAGMLKEVLPKITTPFLFFSEHDCTLDDKPIHWRLIRDLLSQRMANTVRFYWHETIHPEHHHLMGTRAGAFVQTMQWSSWPHCSRVDFYRQLMEENFAENDCTMTETPLYSVVLHSPWEKHRTVIYAPEPDAVRFHHLDARRDPITGEKDAGSW